MYNKGSVLWCDDPICFSVEASFELLNSARATVPGVVVLLGSTVKLVVIASGGVLNGVSPLMFLSMFAASAWSTVGRGVIELPAVRRWASSIARSVLASRPVVEFTVGGGGSTSCCFVVFPYSTVVAVL